MLKILRLLALLTAILLIVSLTDDQATYAQEPPGTESRGSGARNESSQVQALGVSDDVLPDSSPAEGQATGSSGGSGAGSLIGPGNMDHVASPDSVFVTSTGVGDNAAVAAGGRATPSASSDDGVLVSRSLRDLEPEAERLVIIVLREDSEVSSIRAASLFEQASAASGPRGKGEAYRRAAYQAERSSSVSDAKNALREFGTFVEGAIQTQMAPGFRPDPDDPQASDSYLFYLNAVVIRVAAKNIEQIEKLPFVEQIWDGEIELRPSSTGHSLLRSSSTTTTGPLLAQVTETWQDIVNSNWGYSNIGADQLHAAGFRGRGVWISVIDTGLDVDNPLVFDFLGAPDGTPDPFISGWNGRLNVFGGTWPVYALDRYDDPDGHGTQDAGVVWQVAPEANFLISRADNLFHLAGMVNWANGAGAEVITTSLGRGGAQPHDGTNGLFDPAPISENFSGARDGDTTVVAAAGNKCGKSVADFPVEPGTGRYVFSVSSINNTTANGIHNIDTCASPTNASVNNWGEPKPSIAAPGAGIYTLDALQNSAAGTTVNSGSSFAAPHFAGSAAVLRGINPGPRAVEQALVLTATGVPNNSLDGAGYINVWAAAKLLDNIAPENPTSWSFSHQVGNCINDSTIGASWSGASDSLSGVQGYSYQWSQDGTTVPDQVLDTVGTNTTSLSLTNGDWYFHLRTVDNRGNWSGATHQGPFCVNTTTPPVRTSIQVSVQLNPSTVFTGAATTVSGTATYNTGEPVHPGTAVIGVGGNTWTAPTNASGQFSRLVSAPPSPGNYVASVSFDEPQPGGGSVSGSGNANLQVIPDAGSGSNYLFGDALTAKDQQASDPFLPLNVIDHFRSTDEKVLAWMELNDVYAQSRSPVIEARFRWYAPNGSLHLATPNIPLDLPPPGQFWGWYRVAWFLNINGQPRSEIEGLWQVQFQVNEGGGWDTVATREFFLRYVLAEHKTAKSAQGSDPFDPIDPTDHFLSSDSYVYAWARFNDVTESIMVRWKYFEPNGSLYDQFELVAPTDDPGANSWWDWYKVWGRIPVSGNAAASKTGNWRVAVEVLDPLGNWDQEFEDYFRIDESPLQAPSVNVTLSPSPVNEGQGVTAQINVSDNGYLDDVTAYWQVDGGPTQSQILADNLNSNSFSGSLPLGSFSEGQRIQVYATAKDNSGGSGTSPPQILIAQDTDTIGPVITNVSAVELNGDGDGLVELGERARISWTSNDPAGVASTDLVLDGQSQTVSTSGSPTSLDASSDIGPVTTVGPHPFTITATDADTSPEPSAHLGTLTVSGPQPALAVLNSPFLQSGALEYEFVSFQPNSPVIVEVFGGGGVTKISDSEGGGSGSFGTTEPSGDYLLRATDDFDHIATADFSVILPQPIVVVPRLNPALDSDGIAVAEIMIYGLKDVGTGATSTTFADGMVSASGVLMYEAPSLHVVAMRPGPSFDLTDFTDSTTTQQVSFSVALKAGESPPTTTPVVVARAVVRLIGSAASSTVLKLTSLTVTEANTGLQIGQETEASNTYLRADALQDGTTNIVDALALLQCHFKIIPVGNKAGIECHPINSAGPVHDGAVGDKVNIVDALAVLRRHFNLVNVFFE